MNRKVYINPKQYSVLKESEWNLHYGGYDNGYGHGGHNMKPHMSDNKYVMVGRDTGHFGSGTYFSTYSFSDTQSQPLRDSMNNPDPNFIQIGDNVYRVDLDLYKNLYRVRSKKQGDILYTMMKNLNMMYNKICHYMGNFEDGSHANYNNAINYQIISRNAEALNLKCPSYYKLTRMAQEHGKDKDAIQSFSTLFMELNGYNGVNVSGVEYYDNTLHGSVIYDLSKVNTDMEEVSPKSLFTGLRDRSYDNTIASKGYSDEIADSLNGEYINWYDEINKMPVPHAMRALKNYTDSGHLLNAFTVRKFNEDLQKRYLRLIFAKDPTDMFGKSLCTELLSGDDSRWYLELIENTKSYYWVNYYDERYKVSGLVKLLWNYSPSWGLSSEEQMADKERYLEMLEGYMQRDLTPMEEEYIKEDFLYDWDGFYSSLNSK